MTIRKHWNHFIVLFRSLLLPLFESLFVICAPLAIRIFVLKYDTLYAFDEKQPMKWQFSNRFFLSLSAFRMFSSLVLVLCSELRLIIPLSFIFFLLGSRAFTIPCCSLFSVVFFLCYFACTFKRLLLYSICWEPKKARKFRTHI